MGMKGRGILGVYMALLALFAVHSPREYRSSHLVSGKMKGGGSFAFDTRRAHLHRVKRQRAAGRAA